MVISCFERWHPKQNCYLPKLKHFDPQSFWAGYATGFIERLLKAAQKVLGSGMRLPQMWLQTTGINGVEFASGAAFEVIVVSCVVFQTLIHHIQSQRG